MFLQPRTWDEALDDRAHHPDALPVAGGTDVLVDINVGRAHPDAVLDLTRVPSLREWSTGPDGARIGACVTYTELIAGFARPLPGLVMAARSVGSPPIRHRGTIGGNLGSASPAGDCHPPLLASGASVEVASVRGVRTVPVREFFLGPKRNALAADELISTVCAPAATGPQVFTKVGPRNAMVIAVCSFALALDPRRGVVGTGMGSVGPVPLVADGAAHFLEDHLEAAGLWRSREPLDPSVVGRFAELVVGAARPIDDVRGTAAYRRHALHVLARRSLQWCWDDYCGGAT
ncbi:MAG TPA: FAD binding domain-containing protein [Acidimicrobiales bacterium]|nr:FAD binding domain-containing protein [Acidimicrobiales bacterium]